MAMHSCSREMEFESVLSFRDLGGYRTREGQTVAWRRLFRSGELHHMTGRDASRLKEEIGLRSVIDLRHPTELEQEGVGPLNEVGAEHYNIPLAISNERLVYRDCSNMGEVYLHLMGHEGYGRRVVEALEVIAEPDNHPLVFHCNAGKDRTGILASVVLGILGVSDKDIIEDYTLTAPHMKELINRWSSNPETAERVKSGPEYIWEASPESMAFFLSTLKGEYGSVRGYVEAHAAEASLIHRLEKALLARPPL